MNLVYLRVQKEGLGGKGETSKQRSSFVAVSCCVIFMVKCLRFWEKSFVTLYDMQKEKESSSVGEIFLSFFHQGVRKVENFAPSRKRSLFQGWNFLA